MRGALPLLAALGALSACDDDSAPAAVDAGVHALASPAPTPGAWLGVTGVGDAMFAVGGTLEPPAGTIAALGPAGWHLEAAPDGPNLWWVFGLNPEQIWACGAGGRVLRRQADAWEPEPTGLADDAVLWGLWGTPGDLWAVGGTQLPRGPRGVVLRSTGDGAWTRVVDPALPLEDPADEFAGLNLYKVWGAAPDAVYLVGEGGVALRWDGAAFTRLDTATRDILFTVHGQPGGLVLAVGGLTEGVVRRLDGDRFVDDGAPPSPPLNGVFVRPDGSALAAGARGVVLERSPAGAWRRLRPPADDTIGDRTLHALWAGPRTFAVGGDLTALREGVIATDQRPVPTWEGP